MGHIRVRKENSKLLLDFFNQGVRCREQTSLPDTPANRRKLEKLLSQVELEIKLGKFNYASHFPNSKLAQRFSTAAPAGDPTVAQPVTSFTPVVQAVAPSAGDHSPLFRDFIVEWIAENQIGWRRSHITNIQGMVKKHYLPVFGSIRVGHITRPDILKFRSSLAKVSGRNGNEGLSANRINKIMDPLRRVFEEAADRYEFNTPFVQ